MTIPPLLQEAVTAGVMGVMVTGVIGVVVTGVLAAGVMAVVGAGAGVLTVGLKPRTNPMSP
jgi:hypothetical protein